MNKNIFFLFSLVALVVPSISLLSLNNSNTSISLTAKSIDVNESTIDSSINLEDALPVFDDSISSFGDYIVSYEDNNIYPVNTTIPSLATDNQTNIKAGGATVGMTANKQTITLTTYAGLLLWSHKLSENPLLKKYYSLVKSINDISTYKVINFAYLESKNILFILFGQEERTNNTLKNLTVFGLDINSGAIIVPKEGLLTNNQVIASARDNSAFIFFNSSDQLVITSGKKVSDLTASTKIMSFDENSTGFANVKGNDEANNNFSFSSVVPVNAANDYLLGFLPSTVKGVNFSIWLYSSVQGSSSKPSLSYKTSNNTTGAPDKSVGSGNSSFNYYIVPVKDDFNNIDSSGYRFRVVNNVNSTTYRGYINNQSVMPDFNNITKRFFVTPSSHNGSITSESVVFLLDSFDKMFSSFASLSLTINDNGTSLPGFGETKIYMNYLSNQMTGPTNLNLGTDATTGRKTGLENDVVVNNWELNSVGYDKQSNFVYLSLSGEAYDFSQNSPGEIIANKYLTNSRYVDLKPETADANRVSTDAYVQDSPYTLSDVNFDTYTDSKNLYLAKQVIDGNDGEWLSTSIENFNNNAEDFKPTKDSKINFSSLRNFENEIENSEILNDVMPSVINDNLDNLDKFLNDKGISDIVKFKNAIGNDETGEIRLETEITYANDFGDQILNGNVSYTSFIQVVGFTKNDFSLTFKENTDAAVIDIKAKYSAEKIVEDNNKAFVINHLLQNFTIKGQKFIPDPSTVTLKNTPNSNDLTVEINVPIKTSLNDESGILPVGFPKNDAIVTITYSGFTGTEAPPIETFPDNTDNSNFNNKLSNEIIAGIVIGGLVIAAIIVLITMIVKVRIETNKQFL
ncbi:MAG: hypothetical protein K2G54_03295, partial [Malacoplasma sp.]|nr:hypothetical protein [Malacoplasma sp.]